MQQTLLLMLGYPGSGKTTAAKTLCQLTDAVHIWADDERAKRFTQPTHSRTETNALYAALNEQVRQLLQTGKSALFDANFNRYRDRQRLRRIAASCGAQTIIVWMRVPETTALQRATRPDSNRTFQVSEKDFWRMARNLQPPREDEPYITLDGTKLITQELLQQKLANLK